MRILHLSDVHYCTTWHQEFSEYYEKLLCKLEEINSHKRIDLILLTGDLIDRGGSRMRIKNKNCYKVFEEVFITPILSKLAIPKSNFVFIPGNHDIDIAKARGPEELGLAGYSIEKINEFVANNKYRFQGGTNRIRKFKDFEQEFYQKIKDYKYSIFESCWICDMKGSRVGIVGLNSAWRCASGAEIANLQMGAEKQITAARQYFRGKTDFNIALLHHPIDYLSEKERDDVQKYLMDAGFTLLFGGHSHKTKHYQIVNAEKSIFQILSRIGFNTHREENQLYQAGFSAIDLSVESSQANSITVTSNFYKFENIRLEFDVDTSAGKEGKTIHYISTKNSTPTFLSYLRSFNVSDSNQLANLEQIRQQMRNSWSQLTSALIQTSFRDISDKLSEKIKQRTLPERLDFYHANHTFFYEINDIDDWHVELVEHQKFTIKSSLDGLSYTDAYVVEKLTGSADKSEIEIEKLTINDIDHITNVTTERQLLDNNIERIGKRFHIDLENCNEYNVELIVRSVHSLILNCYWRVHMGVITEGVVVHMSSNPHYEVDIINFTNDTNSENIYVPLGHNKSDGPELLMPGDGFVLVMKKKKSDD